VFGSDVPGRVEVGVQGEAALTAEEQGLRPTVGTMLMTALRTSLTGMARVDEGHAHPHGFRLVFDKGAKLGERPAVQSAIELVRGLRAVPNVLQVFQDDRSTGLDGIDDAAGKNMVAIAAETSLPAEQMASGTWDTTPRPRRAGNRTQRRCRKMDKRLSA
jgi:hypothetical protein